MRSDTVRKYEALSAKTGIPSIVLYLISLLISIAIVACCYFCCKKLCCKKKQQGGLVLNRPPAPNPVPDSPGYNPTDSGINPTYPETNPSPPYNPTYPGNPIAAYNGNNPLYLGNPMPAYSAVNPPQSYHIGNPTTNPGNLTYSRVNPSPPNVVPIGGNPMPIYPSLNPTIAGVSTTTSAEINSGARNTDLNV